MTINNILQSLCFEYHPSQVGERKFKIETIDFANTHERLLTVITKRLDLLLEEATDPTLKKSYLSVR